MSRLAVRQFGSASEFLSVCGSWLEASEAENHLVLGITARLAHAWDAQSPEQSSAFLEARLGAACVGAAVQEVGRKIVLASPCLPEAAVAIAERVSQSLSEGMAPPRKVPGVLGEAAAVEAFAEAWSRLGRGAPRPGLKLALYRLQKVIPPARPPAGGLRLAAESELPLLLRWAKNFAQEAGPDTSPAETEAAIRSALSSGSLWVWEDVGELKSMARCSGSPPRGARISLVYTPAAERGQGYASALVAALSQQQLEQGLRSLFLFADLANPTSNSIYCKIGFERVSEVQEVLFT
jgi:GNAT superfamily N-acetyltransferase